MEKQQSEMGPADEKTDGNDTTKQNMPKTVSLSDLEAGGIEIIPNLNLLNLKDFQEAETPQRTVSETDSAISSLDCKVPNTTMEPERSPKEFGGVKKKQNRKDRSKKIDTPWDTIVKYCLEDSTLSESEKFDYIRSKYEEIAAQCLNYAKDNRALRRQVSEIEAEKTKLTKENERNLQSRLQLDRLCRELQTRLKILTKDIAVEKKENAEHRKMQAKTSKIAQQLDDITTQVKSSSDMALKLQTENETMVLKFESARNQFVQRDKEFKAVSAQLEKERSMHKDQINLQAELLLQSQQALESGSEEKLKLLRSIRELEDQIKTYRQEYTNFDETVKKSHQSFSSLQKEFDKMSKHLMAVDKERATTRKKYEDCEMALIRASELCSKSDAKINTLEKLCRQLHHERHHFAEQLKANNIEIQPIPPFQSGTAPLTKKEKEIAKLRKELHAAEENLKRMLATNKSDEKSHAETSTQEHTPPETL